MKILEADAAVAKQVDFLKLKKKSLKNKCFESNSSRNPRRDLADRGDQKFSDKPEDYFYFENYIPESFLKDLKLDVEEESRPKLIAWLGNNIVSE
uniref:Uncharacterized protein n=1 Tax=Sphaerodactylus townsendi TaxID=933632 RepID=A0ACB8EI36_9SAUR